MQCGSEKQMETKKTVGKTSWQGAAAVALSLLSLPAALAQTSFVSEESEGCSSVVEWLS